MLGALRIPCQDASGVTPASLRGGGATAMFEAVGDIDQVRHRGRWASVKTCNIYVQEVGGHRFLAQLAPPIRKEVQRRAGEAPGALLLALDRLDASGRATGGQS